MENNELNQRLNELLAGVKSEDSDKVFEVCKRIVECPRMLTCLDFNDIANPIRNCDAVEAVAFDCLGKEMSEKVRSELVNWAGKDHWVPQNLLVFMELHNGYSPIMSDIASVHESLQVLPTDINIIWGIGVNPDGESEVGIYFIMGYKKVEGVSQNDSGNE